MARENFIDVDDYPPDEDEYERDEREGIQFGDAPSWWDDSMPDEWWDAPDDWVVYEYEIGIDYGEE